MRHGDGSRGRPGSCRPDPPAPLARQGPASQSVLPLRRRAPPDLARPVPGSPAGYEQAARGRLAVATSIPPGGSAGGSAATLPAVDPKGRAVVFFEAVGHQQHAPASRPSMTEASSSLLRKNARASRFPGIEVHPEKGRQLQKHDLHGRRPAWDRSPREEGTRSPRCRAPVVCAICRRRRRGPACRRTRQRLRVRPSPHPACRGPPGASAAPQAAAPAARPQSSCRVPRPGPGHRCPRGLRRGAGGEPAGGEQVVAVNMAGLPGQVAGAEVAAPCPGLLLGHAGDRRGRGEERRWPTRLPRPTLAQQRVTLAGDGQRPPAKGASSGATADRRAARGRRAPS